MQEFLTKTAENYVNLTAVSVEEVLLRVGLVIAFCMVLGLERDTKNKPIDFRAYIIVGVTTCVVAILAQELMAQLGQGGSGDMDLAKIIAGVLTGIGFLGAGAIIVKDDRVVGTATGASIWASGGIGLCLGFGFYTLAFITFAAIALTLIGGALVMRLMQGRKDDESA